MAAERHPLVHTGDRNICAWQPEVKHVNPVTADPQIREVLCKPNTGERGFDRKALSSVAEFGHVSDQQSPGGDC